MITITYAKLTTENFDEHSLDLFKRYQEVKQCLRYVNDQYIYVDNSFVEDWDIEKCRIVANEIIHAIKNGAIAYGAFYGNRVIGFIYVDTNYFGKENQYIELKLFQVSSEFRNKGIGKSLFSLTCTEAKKTKATKLYISAHSSKESQEAYRHIGCVPAQEINQQLAEDEPCDIQMEYSL